jgi:hypothetical protein
MSHAITNAIHAAPATDRATQTKPVATSAASSQKSSPAQPSSTPTDTLQISSAAKAALHEAVETPTHTVQEAGVEIIRLRDCSRNKPL